MGAKRLPKLTLPKDPAAIGYIAGMIDADGCIGINSAFQKSKSKNKSHSLRVSITNTDERLILWLIDTLGGGLNIKRNRKNKNWKIAYDWTVNAHQAEQLLETVLPYLIVKKEQALLAIKFRSIKTSWIGGSLDSKVVDFREHCKKEMSILNKRGIA